MGLYRWHIGRTVLVNVTNGDMLRGQLTRATGAGIEITRPRQVQPDGAEHEIGGIILIPTASIGTIQVEARHGV